MLLNHTLVSNGLEILFHKTGSSYSCYLCIHGKVYMLCQDTVIFYYPLDNSFLYPSQFMHVNAAGTTVLLQAAYKFKVEKFIYMSTDEVYGDSVDKVSRTWTWLLVALKFQWVFLESKYTSLLYFIGTSFMFVISHTLGRRVNRYSKRIFSSGIHFLRFFKCEDCEWWKFKMLTVSQRRFYMNDSFCVSLSVYTKLV